MYTSLVTAADRYVALLAEIRAEFPGFRLVRKDRSPTQRLIHYGLMAITLGGMRAYLNGYQTTIGKTVYVTADWDERDPDERYMIMCHERVHLRQFRRYTLPGMALLYLLCPLPMGLAYGRAWMEMEAYAETIRATAAIRGTACVRDPAFRERIVAQFLGPSYGWMWPFRRQLEAWYERVLSEVDASCARPDPTADPMPEPIADEHQMGTRYADGQAHEPMVAGGEVAHRLKARPDQGRAVGAGGARME